MNARVATRELAPSDLLVARRVLASAFASEPFAIGMFGESLVDRFAGIRDEYAHWPFGVDPFALVATVADAVVAVALAARPGQCRLCHDFDVVIEPGLAESERVNREFRIACHHVHAGAGLAPDHAHIASVAVDPALHGAGIGATIVRALVERLWALDASMVVLECLATRASFYERLGFRAVAEFDDPGGPNLRANLMRIDAS